jgi:hypothetical protein
MKKFLLLLLLAFGVQQMKAQLTLTLNHTNVNCNSSCTGTITAVPSGGTPPYAYNWTPNISMTSTANAVCAGTYTVLVTDQLSNTASATVTITQPMAITVNFTSVVNATCGNPNGSVTVVPSGGTPPYTYSWNSTPVQTTATATNLPAATYTCTVTDGSGCSVSNAVFIANMAGPTASITSSTNASCNGACDGSATAAFSGGTAPYSYYWTPSGGPNLATTPNLCAGVYYFNVTDANGCIATASVYITQPPALAPNISSFNCSCNAICDGSAGSSPTGGTAPYTYTWSNSSTNPTISSLCPGNYTVTVTDAHSCSANAIAVITQPAAVPVAISPSYPTICAGSTITMTGSGAMTYVWSPGFLTTSSITITPTTTTTYTLTGTNAMGCTGTAVSTVYVNQSPSITVTASNNPSCFGGSDGSINTSSSGGTPPYNYAWTPSAAITSNVTGLTAGSYTVSISDANGCMGTASAMLANPAQLVVSPGSMTPAGCNFSNGSADVSASGGTGTISYSWSPSANTTFSATNLPAGTETVTVTDANGCTATTSVTVTDSCDYVWPGDANDDAVAGNNDILDIGIANGATGTTRANASLNWIGQPSANWGQTLASGTDYKFVDCNGDGAINPNDTNAVIQNFGFIHNNRTGGIPVYDASLPDLTVTMGQSTLASNTPGTMTISLGNSTTPASNVYGIAFTLNFDATQISAPSFRMNENGTWMGTPGNDMMGVVMNSGTGTGAVQIAITRLDHQNVNGFGDIANLGFVTTSDLVGSGTAQNVNFTISNVTIISANETPQTVNIVNDSVTVSDPALMMGISSFDNSNELSAYPNPFNESVQIILPSIAREKNCELVITDAMGRMVRTEQVKGNSFLVQRGSMDAGIYICSVHCEGRVIANTKLVVK